MKYRIPVAAPDIAETERQRVLEAVSSGWVSSKGPFVEEFESEFSSFVGMRHGVSTSSGTSALHLSMAALGIGKGDKVLVPSLTFVAVANAVMYTGAVPVFIDSHKEYWCMDPSLIEEKIDRSTKAIIPVHLYGHPCNMDQIMRIAKEHSLYVIEDCAEAHGAEYIGRKVGSFGTISCFSFYGNKIITTGEGGICLTNDEDLMNKMRLLRDHGMDPKRRYWYDHIGFNYRMTNLQAALGVAQLERIQNFITRKRYIADLYRMAFKGHSAITPAPEMPWARSVYWLYSILLSGDLRDKVMHHLEKDGIETRPFFHPIHTLPPYKSMDSRSPLSENISLRGLNLPSGHKLSDQEVELVAQSLLAAIELI